MESIAGFLLINIYALLLIIATCIIFFSKQRARQVEDEIYKNFLLTNVFMSISGLILGIFVSPDFFNRSIVVIFNKLYLISLLLWIYLLTVYTVYISLKDKIKKYRKLGNILIVISVILIIVLPIEVNLTEGASAVATGPSVMITYLVAAVGFLIQIISLFLNYKNLKSKKYIPLYLLIILGTLVLVIQIVNPTLNYLINPILIFIAYIMYFTIENPDAKVLEEVHRANEISDNANEEKAIFLYNMTNEIRSITKDIDDSADSIINAIGSEKIDVEEIGYSARDIKTSTSKFTMMTNEILDISQVDSTNIKIYNDKYNIKLIIKELVQKYKRECENKNLDFRSNIASDVPEYLYGDSVGLKKALSIILDNSIKYTNDGFIEFSVNIIKKRDVCRLIISVEDSGVGIKAEDLFKIFSKKQEDREDNRHNLDSNLYNAKRLITLMNGTIIPNSVYDKGTTIKVVLDQKMVDIDTSGLNKYEKVYDKKKILLVDDNESSVKIISKLLDGTNIILDTVSLGSECLDKIRNKEKYDLILLDEEMKPLDGITVMRKLKSIRTFNTNVILLTRNNNHEYDESYLKYGFVDYILKPIDKDKLLEKISKYV